MPVSVQVFFFFFFLRQLYMQLYNWCFQCYVFLLFSCLYTLRIWECHKCKTADITGRICKQQHPLRAQSVYICAVLRYYCAISAFPYSSLFFYDTFNGFWVHRKHVCIIVHSATKRTVVFQLIYNVFLALVTELSLGKNTGKLDISHAPKINWS